MNAENYVNKEISWLDFNDRILSEAEREDLSPMERLKFISIWRSNLDEFIRVRVGALIHRMKINPEYHDTNNNQSGWDLLRNIRYLVGEQILTAHGIYEELLDTFGNLYQREVISRVLYPNTAFLNDRLYLEDVKAYADVTIVRKGDMMPHLENGVTYLIAHITGKKPAYAIVDMSRMFKFYILGEDHSDDGYTHLQWVADSSLLVTRYLKKLVKRYHVDSVYQFRILRNADIMLSVETCKGNERFEKFIRKMTSHRRRLRPIWMEIRSMREWSMGESCEYDAPTIEFLREKFDLSEDQVYVTKMPLDLDFRDYLPNRNDLESSEAQPIDIMEAMNPPYPINPASRGHLYYILGRQYYSSEHNLLLHFPYHSMSTFINLLYSAANDSECTSIQITLYRMAENSRVAAALAYAASRRKKVTCFLELRARFDEDANVDYSEYLSEAGCTVLHGPPEYKLHGKACLIEGVNDEGKTWRVSCIGTGNFNETSAKQYSDLLYITGHIGIGAQLEHIFRLLKESDNLDFYANQVSISPKQLKTRLLNYMEREKRNGEHGYMCLKCNGLDDPDIMDKIIECANAGVQIDLIVRGICCINLNQDVKNIRIVSVIGHYLEHARIYWFGIGDRAEVMISSADLRERNLDHRVEFAVRIEDAESKDIINHLLKIQLYPDARVYEMNEHGIYAINELKDYTPSMYKDVHMETRRYLSSLASED